MRPTDAGSGERYLRETRHGRGRIVDEDERPVVYTATGGEPARG